jgi:uncharacterized membrane protein YdjX (TVP38/TMEM64 family)
MAPPLRPGKAYVCVTPSKRSGVGRARRGRTARIAPARGGLEGIDYGMRRTTSERTGFTAKDGGLPVTRTLTTPAALKRFGPLLVLAAVLGLVIGMGWHKLLTLENVVHARDQFHGILAEHRVLSVLIYVVTYIAIATLSLPGGLLLTVTGGLLFGWLVGGLAALVGATTGAVFLFLIARSAFGEGLTERAGPWLGKLREGFKEEALSYLLFLRLVPAFPFWFVNVAPAILGVPLKTYIIATFFGIIPATFAFASAGAGLDSVIAAAKAEYAACVQAKGAAACKLKLHASSLLTTELMLALVLLGVVALIPVGLKKWKNAHAAAK